MKATSIVILALSSLTFGALEAQAASTVTTVTKSPSGAAGGVPALIGIQINGPIPPPGTTVTLSRGAPTPGYCSKVESSCLNGREPQSNSRTLCPGINTDYEEQCAEEKLRCEVGYNNCLDQ
jgi:hypothetical protein